MFLYVLGSLSVLLVALLGNLDCLVARANCLASVKALQPSLSSSDFGDDEPAEKASWSCPSTGRRSLRHEQMYVQYITTNELSKFSKP